jgi:Flp pilus assembly protein TadD
MSPANLELLSNRATRHAEAGNWEAARAGWLAALALAPGSADIMIELSYVESLAGHYRQARDWTLRAASATSRSVGAIPALVKRLRTFNDTVLLRELVARLLEDAGTPSVVLVECATQLSNLNDFDLALQCAEAAAGKDPGSLLARLVRGQLRAQHGRVEEASADFDWALARNPRIATAWWMLSRLRKQTPASNHVARLRGLLETPGLRPGDVAALARALHKELDDLGEHEAAWQALQRLCSAMHPGVRYAPAETRTLVDALVAWRPSGTAPAALTVAPDASARTPVFIVGMHRSGTTLLEQMLDASPSVRALGELFDFTAEMRYATDYHCRIPIDAALVERAQGLDLAGVGRRYLDGVEWRLGAESHFTDKQPANFLNLGFICQALPQARILHMVRDPVETCFSNLRELYSDVNRHSYDQLDLADYFLQYRRLMAHWHAMFPGRILDVDYARLTTDPQPVMREVAAFCGIDYVEGMRSTRSSTRAVATASAIQVREEVAARTVPKWMPYAAHLQPLIQALRQGGIEAG